MLNISWAFVVFFWFCTDLQCLGVPRRERLPTSSKCLAMGLAVESKFSAGDHVSAREHLSWKEASRLAFMRSLFNKAQEMLYQMLHLPPIGRRLSGNYSDIPESQH